MSNNGMFTSRTSDWATPKNFFDELNAEFNFTLDPCATPENAKCAKFFTEADNGLAQSWAGETVFCNPPYGRFISDWVQKCYEENRKNGVTVVMLIPARTDTNYFHDYIYKKHEIRFIKGRLHFNESKRTAPFPSMVVVMRNKENKNVKEITMTIKVKLDENAFVPERAHEADAGYDLRSPVDGYVTALGSTIVDTGVHVEIPKGYVGFLKSKSGLNTKHGVCGEGVIDSGYTGSIKAKLYNYSNYPYGFERGDKLIQLVILPIITPALEVVTELNETERGNNGFGSTGR